MSGAVDAARDSLAGLVDIRRLDDDEVLDRYARAVWTALVEPGDGVAGQLIAEVGADHALRAVRSDGSCPSKAVADADLQRGRERWRPRLGDARMGMEVARRAGARLVVPDDPEWPRLLNDLGPHAPLALWARGRPAALAGNTPTVAIVGARASTSYGDYVAADLAGDLAQSGVRVVSGAAYGIDAAAHRAALTASTPGIAVLAGGVDRAYPAGHARLLASIAQHGVVISEVMCGTAPTKWRFLQRNRLIAGLADATIVVEAGPRSGSLNTAAHAASLGRALGAVPGPVTSAASIGSHRVLREFDGRCVTSADDVRELLGLSSASDAIGGAADRTRTDDSTRVLDALSSRTSRPLQDVARRAGLSPSDAASLLGLLGLQGRAVSDGAGWRRS